MSFVFVPVFPSPPQGWHRVAQVKAVHVVGVHHSWRNPSLGSPILDNGLQANLTDHRPEGHSIIWTVSRAALHSRGSHTLCLSRLLALLQTNLKRVQDKSSQFRCAETWDSWIIVTTSCLLWLCLLDCDNSFYTVYIRTLADTCVHMFCSGLWFAVWFVACLFVNYFKGQSF